MASSNPFLITSNRQTTTGFGTILSAVIADVTSDAIDVRDVRWLTIELTESGTVNNRQADLTLTQSVDGVTYDNFNMLIDNIVADAGAGTAGEDIGFTRIATKNIAAAGTDTMYVDARHLAFIKLDLDVTDGGSPTGAFTVKLFGKS